MFGIENTFTVRQENKNSAGIKCHIPATVDVSTPDLDHTPCAFQDPPWITFYLRTEEDNVSSLRLCLCRSWLQMCQCRGSLDLRRGVVGLLVWTALGVASC